MAMALRVRRLKEAYRLLPLLPTANRCNNLLVKDSILLPPLLNYSKNLRVDINSRCRYRCHQDHRYSTISEAVSEQPLVQLDLPSFIKSTIDESEGKIDIRLNVDIPEYVDLIEPLSQNYIWWQTRGAATEISEADSTITSSEKVGIAQQWYDEIDHLAFSTSEIDATIEKRTMSRGEEIPEGKVEISCSVNSSPGTSEVIICAALYLRLKKDSDARSDGRERKAAMIADFLNPGRRANRDLILQFLLASNRDLEEVIITRPVQVRLKFDCPNHPKADNSKDIILTDTSLNVNVAL